MIGLGAAAEADLDSRRSHHDNGEDHEHDDFSRVFVWRCPRSPIADLFVERLQRMIAAEPILRVKGFLAVDGKPMRLVLQGVGDRVHRYFDRAWHPEESREGRLVVIGERGLDQAAIEAALAA